MGVLCTIAIPVMADIYLVIVGSMHIHLCCQQALYVECLKLITLFNGNPDQNGTATACNAVQGEPVISDVMQGGFKYEIVGRAQAGLPQ